MTREEAIEIYKGLINPNIIEAFEVLVPELKEIGYDRMREQIIRGFENWKGNGNVTFNNLRVDDILDWFEKQKECCLVIPSGDTAPAEQDTISKNEQEFLENEIKAFLCNYDMEFDDDAPTYDIAEHFYRLGKKKQEKQKPVPISCGHENGTPAEVCYGPKGDPDPADTPEYEYIRKDAILERIKERLKLYDPDDPEEETVCYELQSIIRYLNEKEETK